MTIEEAAKHYASVTDPEAHGIDFMCEVFIAGAEWDREQMMKEAVEGVLVDNVDGTQEICLHGNRYGDKVKLIIVKE